MKYLSQPFVLNHHGIPVHIRYTDARTMSLRVREREPRVRLNIPAGTDFDRAMEFLGSNTDFIRRALAREARQMPEHTREEYRHFCNVVAEKIEEQRIRLGHPPVAIRIKMMRSQWGSCIAGRRIICINARLIDYPPRCLEYVIIHELSHLRHQNHSAEFWHEVARWCPDWKSLRARLRQAP